MYSNCFFAFSLMAVLQSNLVGVIDFRQEVWPILEKRCIECHREPYEKNGLLKKPKAGLRLDGAAYILHGSDEGTVVVVDHPSKSALYQRVILPENDADHMPPKGDSLTTNQKEILRMWIAEGVDFGTWVGAIDGVEELAERKKNELVQQASYLKEVDQLSEGLIPLNREKLKDLSLKSGLLIRPLGIGSPLVEVRVVTEPTKITDGMIKELIPLKEHLAKIDLRNSAITDQSLIEISSFPRLTHLNLMGTQITSKGIRFLRKTQKLENLNLVSTQVSDSVVETIVIFPNLQRLFLWNSNISEAGVSALREKKNDLVVSF